MLAGEGGEAKLGYQAHYVVDEYRSSRLLMDLTDLFQCCFLLLRDLRCYHLRRVQVLSRPPKNLGISQAQALSILRTTRA
jgi:hypothetical protein